MWPIHASNPAPLIINRFRKASSCEKWNDLCENFYCWSETPTQTLFPLLGWHGRRGDSVVSDRQRVQVASARPQSNMLFLVFTFFDRLSGIHFMNGTFCDHGYYAPKEGGTNHFYNSATRAAMSAEPFGWLLTSESVSNRSVSAWGCCCERSCVKIPSTSILFPGFAHAATRVVVHRLCKYTTCLRWCTLSHQIYVCMLYCMYSILICNGMAHAHVLSLHTHHIYLFTK